MQLLSLYARDGRVLCVAWVTVPYPPRVAVNSGPCRGLYFDWDAAGQRYVQEDTVAPVLGAAAGAAEAAGVRALLTPDQLVQLAADGVSNVLARPGARWFLKPDQLAALRAFRSALLSNGPAVGPFVNLWLGLVPASYESESGEQMADKKSNESHGLGAVPQDIVDQVELIKETVKADSNELFLEAKDLAVMCRDYGVETVRSILGTILSKLK